MDDGAGCAALTGVVVVIVIAVLTVKFSQADSRAEGYRAGWCEGRGGQWVQDACVDSLRIRHDTTEAPSAER